MDYEQTTQWLFAKLPMYQQQGASAYRSDLTNIRLLSAHLGHPHQDFRTVHVAGTNGKGSTSHMLASVLQEAGCKTGLYTSPHLKDYRERIKIDGIEIERDFVVDFVQRNREFFEAHDLSFFEMSVGMAFEYFKEQRVDVAVIETGMGGRLDATNIITPILSVITNISLDHTQFLGNTLAAIAGEKAGIIKPGIPVVIGEYVTETRPVFERKATECGSEIHYASQEVAQPLPTALKGNYQQHNVRTVMSAVGILKRNFDISDDALTNGLMHVLDNTGLKGRWQQLSQHPKVVCDTAHNPAGIGLVVRQITAETYRRLHFVIGMVNDKDLGGILTLLPKDAIYYFCKPDIRRGLEAEVLREQAAAFGLHGKIYDTVALAYEAAKQEAHTDDFIFIGGSTFVVAEVL